MRPLRIGIDAHMVGERETGNETVILGLAEGLCALTSPHEYRLLTPRPERLRGVVDGRVPGTRLRVRRTLPLPAPLRIPFGLPLAARHARLDLLHVTYVAPPVSAPVVLLVHDVAYRLYPEAFSPRVRWQLGLLVPLSIRRARRVLTVSEAARRDIERCYPHAVGKTVAVHNGVRAIFRPLASGPVLATVRARYALPERFLLAVGDLQPRKNLGVLLEAFAAALAELPDLYLVIAGKDKWRGGTLVERVRALGLAERVRLVGYVPDDDLVALYNLAWGFCYPSRYEGFGLPPLEAMACGTPTITSDAASLPEVVGEAALRVGPDDVAGLAAAIRRLAEPAVRERLRRAGLERAARFTWLESARQTERVFEAAVFGRPCAGG